MMMSTQQPQKLNFLHDVPFMCHMCANDFLTYVWIQFEKYWQFLMEWAPYCQNRKFLAPCSSIWSWKMIWKKIENFEIVFENWATWRLGISNFDARGLIRQEIVSTFRIVFKHKSKNYLHTYGIQKAHHAKNSIFVAVVCSSLCAWCAHITLLGGACHLKVQR